MNRNFIILFFVFIVTEFQAQDVTKEMTLINQFYASCPSYSYSTSYLLYDREESSKVLQQYTGKLFKNGENYRNEIQHTITINNKNEKILVNPDSKKILVTDSEKANVGIPDIESLKNYLKLSDSTRVIKLSDNQKKIEFYFSSISGMEVSKAELFYNKNYQLTSVVMYYGNAQQFIGEDGIEKRILPVLEMKIKDFRCMEIESTLFETNKIITKQESKYVGVGLYSNYEIIDLKK